MEKIEEFLAFKKLLLFGSHSVGKTSLTKSLERGVSTEESQNIEGKKINYYNYFYRCNSKKNRSAY